MPFSRSGPPFLVFQFSFAVWAQGRYRISPRRFLAECRKRQLRVRFSRSADRNAISGLIKTKMAARSGGNL